MKSFGRGFKLCEKCHSNQGVRTRKCKICGNEFPPPQPKINFKNKRKAKTEKVNWKELSKGDKIKVRGGSVYNSHTIPRRGIFIVKKVDEDGIHAYPLKGGGHAFINMTQTGLNKFGFYNEPHKVRKVIEEQNEKL